MSQNQFEVFLSSTFDNAFFKNNSAKNFENIIHQKILCNNHIGAYIKIRNIFIKGVREENFIITLSGLSLAHTHKGSLPILTYCNNYKNNYNNYRSFEFDNDSYIPFSLARENTWKVNIEPWGCISVPSDLDNHCIIHISVKINFDFNMSLIQNSLYLELTDNNDGEFISESLSTPLFLTGNEQIAITDITYPKINNI